MKFLHGKLGNPSTPLNVRLFIAKLIINTEEVTACTVFFVHESKHRSAHCICSFSALNLPPCLISPKQVFHPYARHWLGPLLQLVVSGNNGGEGIHFMVVDIVVTLLSWTSVATPKVCKYFSVLE